MMSDEQLAAFHKAVDDEWVAETRDRLEGARFSPDVPMQEWVAAEYIDDLDPPDPIYHVRALRRRARAEIRKYHPAEPLFCQSRAVRCYLYQQHGRWLVVTEAKFGAMAA
jgi:hypothetical protein